MRRRSADVPLIVVTGAGRSGTSALLHALGHHRQIVQAAPGESPLFNHFMDFLTLYEDTHVDHLYHRQCYKVSALRKRLLVQKFLLAAGAGLLPSDIKDRHVAVKSFPTKKNIQKFLEVFPKLTILHIARNGVDVVTSARKYITKSSIPFDISCQNWADTIWDLSRISDLSNFHLVKHEDLVSEPAATLESIYLKVGLDNDCEPSEYVSSTVINSSFTPDGNKVSSEYFLSRPAAWSSWTAEEREAFTRICARSMQLLGYSIPF